MNDTEVRVHKVQSPKDSLPAYVLYGWPSMRLHEDATRHLSDIATQSSVAHQRNVAYSLSHWHSYCLAAGLDYRLASADDLIAYKRSMANAISALHGDRLSPGTIGQRVLAVVSFYRLGTIRGWYTLALSRSGNDPSADSHGVSRSTGSLQIDARLAKLAPKSGRTSTDIRPLSPAELRSVLGELAPSIELGSKSESAIRDRLIAEWLAFVGLRLGEVLNPLGEMGLTTYQILHLVPDLNYPFDHSIVRLMGKGQKWRNVAVPNWLVAKTIDYIHGERAEAIKGVRRPTSKLFVAGRNSLSKDRGRAITGRAFEKAFSAAALRAGLYRLKETLAHDSNRERLRKKATHCPHDLRHTYAIATYFAERSLGNAEPWKPIQAQLGHRHLATTVDTYLAFVSAHDAWRKDISRVSVRELAGIANA